jgi:hypothetical protein
MFGEPISSPEFNGAETRSGGRWLSLMDYARQNHLSLSTLRRYIKANKVQFKLEQGRYLLWDEGKMNSAPHLDATAEKLRLTQRELQKAKEEIAELKMLIAYYEERQPKTPIDS